MSHIVLILLFLLIPVATGLLTLTIRSARWALRLMLLGIGVALIPGILLITHVYRSGDVYCDNGRFLIDALSAWHIMIMMIVYTLSSIYAVIYFNHELAAAKISLKRIRVFTGLWCATFSTMALTLISDNIGIVWVGIEGTTLFTAFLICIHVNRASLEAMWKYILICSVGVAFAFMGTLLVVASAKGLGLNVHEITLWRTLRAHADALNPMFIKAAFIFLLIGYGTKAGLAPMHNWLPDAHSQAPSPVSALFSGFMLNAALYCIIRFIPIVETTLNHSGWSLQLLRLFGIISMLLAAAFIIFQHDLKRLLAYSSIEHIGIITLGLSLGPIGIFAALFHMLNHSLSKTTAFFSAGRLGQLFNTHDIRMMSGAARASKLWATSLFLSLLALIGVAPSAVFLSEFLVLKAAVYVHSSVAIIAFISATCIVFIGILRQAIPILWGPPDSKVTTCRYGRIEAFTACLPLIALLVLGMWMPRPLRTMLDSAAAVISSPDTRDISALEDRP